MQPLFLETSFWDVILWMVWVFFFTMAIMIFFSVFTDIIRRNDLRGIAKVLWIVFIFILPLLGCLIYMIARPAMTEQDKEMIAAAKRASGYSPTGEIEKAHQLLQSGALTQEEFDKIKANALS